MKLPGYKRCIAGKIAGTLSALGLFHPHPWFGAAIRAYIHSRIGVTRGGIDTG